MEVEGRLDSAGACHTRLDYAELMPSVADILEQEDVVGWYQDRMEFEPRAIARDCGSLGWLQAGS